MKPKIEYRAERRNKNRKKVSNSIGLVIVSEHKPYTKEYAIDLAKTLLWETSDFTHIKNMTGLSILRMLHLGLIEWYYPFKKTIYKDKLDLKGTVVPDTNTTWLRRKDNG